MQGGGDLPWDVTCRGVVDGIAMVIHMTRADGRRVVEEAAMVTGYDAGRNAWDMQRLDRVTVQGRGAPAGQRASRSTRPASVTGTPRRCGRSATPCSGRVDSSTPRRDGSGANEGPSPIGTACAPPRGGQAWAPREHTREPTHTAGPTDERTQERTHDRQRSQSGSNTQYSGEQEPGRHARHDRPARTRRVPTPRTKRGPHMSSTRRAEPSRITVRLPRPGTRWRPTRRHRRANYRRGAALADRTRHRWAR